jgi:ubiquinone/menaquinone biosynthesis C-methylase UbiE
VDAGSHRALTQREFARQSANFEKPRSLFRDTSILAWIADHVPVSPGERILDVAGGTGLLGRHLAGAGASAVIVDVTEEMLATGLRSVLAEREERVTFVRGDAAELPFPDGQFDVVVSRFALHHMQDPAAAVAEMARVCRAGGGVTVIDMVGGGARHDELERLRDPSHTRALAEGELGELLARAGRPPVRLAEREHTMAVEGWLEQSLTPVPQREQILRVLAEEADGGRESGLRAARERTGALTITQRWILAGG